MNKTRQKTIEASNSFKAPNLNERLTNHSSQGANLFKQKGYMRKRNIKEILKEEEE